MSTSFKGPITHGPGSNHGHYRYRTGMGMMPCAEFAILHDDFVLPFATNTTTGWTAIIDTGGTSITHLTAATGANGVVAMTSDNVSEGAALYGAKSWQLTAGKRLFIECRVQMDDVTDNNFQFGLSALTAVTNPEDLWTTTATDLVTFGIGDGDSNPKMLVDKSNSGTSQQVQTVKGMTADTWSTLAIYYDGANIHGYVDGTYVMTWGSASTTIPTGTPLALFVGHLIGNGAAPNTSLVDYIRVVSER